jgi:polyhydroxybutyrate depolymerase
VPGYPVSVYVPRGYTGHHAVPLVLNLHGSSSNGLNQLAGSDMQRAADRHGFLVAVPNGGTSLPGSPGGYAWVLPGVPDTSGQLPSPDDRDDVRFLSDTISTVSDTFCVNTQRVYATGFSGGARMASLLACRLSDRRAAVAPVAGLRAGNPDAADPTRPDPTTCEPARSVPVLAFHGRADQVNPFTGDGAPYWQYSVPEAFDRWADPNGCRPEPNERQLTPHVTLRGYPVCDRGAEVGRPTSCGASSSGTRCPKPSTERTHHELRP